MSELSRVPQRAPGAESDDWQPRSVDAPPDFDFRLRARLASLKGQEPGRVAWNRFAPGSLVVSAGGVIRYLVALGVVVRQFPSRRARTDGEPQTTVTSSPLTRRFRRRIACTYCDATDGADVAQNPR